MRIIIQKTISALIFIIGIICIADFFFYRHMELKYIKDISFGILLFYIGYKGYNLSLQGKKINWFYLFNEHAGAGFGPLITSKDDKRNVSNKIAIPLILFFLTIFLVSLAYVLIKYKLIT